MRFLRIGLFRYLLTATLLLVGANQLAAQQWGPVRSANRTDSIRLVYGDGSFDRPVVDQFGDIRWFEYPNSIGSFTPFDPYAKNPGTPENPPPKNPFAGTNRPFVVSPRPGFPSILQGPSPDNPFKKTTIPPEFGSHKDHYGLIAIFVPSHSVTATVPTPGGTQRFNIADNNSPIPLDRMFVTYNHFNDAVQATIASATQRENVNRYTFGFEKTFLNGGASVELRMPFGDTIDFSSTNFVLNSNGGIGNLALAPKFFLAVQPQYCVTGGLLMSFPTAKDVYGFVDEQFYIVRNESIHLGPFLGFVAANPDSRFFFQAFTQVDFDLTGNQVAARRGNSIANLGSLRQQTELYADLSVGYWINRNPVGRIQGVATLFEIHYLGTLEDSNRLEETIATDPDVNIELRNPANNVDILNLTFAVHLDFARSNLRCGFVVPVSDSSNRAFDYEIGIQFNYLFGKPPPRPLPTPRWMVDSMNNASSMFNGTGRPVQQGYPLHGSPF